MFCEALEGPIENREILHALLYCFRRLLCNENNIIYPATLIQKLSICLEIPDVNISNQAAWALTNMGAGKSENVVTMRQLGIPAKVVVLLQKSTVETQEQVFKL